jgi:hypothetical protein
MWMILAGLGAVAYFVLLKPKSGISMVRPSGATPSPAAIAAVPPTIKQQAIQTGVQVATSLISQAASGSEPDWQKTLVTSL